MSSILKVDTINEVTSANGVTVDGLSIKDSKLVTADSVVTTNITNSNITNAKLASGSFSNITGTGTLTSFRSTGIDDNADALAMTIDSSERVGIGTSSPAAKLQVTTASSSIAPHASADEIAIENSANAGISILSGNSNEAAVYFGDNGDNDIGRIRYSHSENSMDFLVNAGTKVKIHSDGVMAASAGVALGVGTANTASNVLDDYEEGTFTPTIALGITSVGYSSQWGRYTKIGNTVSFSFNVQTNAGTLNSSRLKFGGLPFDVSGSVRGFAVFNFVDGDFINSKTNNLPTLIFEPNPTIETYFTDGSQFLGTNLTNASGNNIYIAGVYESV